MSNFKQASREKLRVSTERGQLSVEQLWDLPVAVLDRTAVQLEEEYKSSGKKSFLVKKSRKDKTVKLRFDVVVEILSAKVEEAEVTRNASANKQHNEKILNLIQEKQEGDLQDLTVEELEKLLKSKIMFKTKRATVQTLTQEKGQVLEKFQSFIGSIKNITATALKEKEVKIEEAKLATLEASQLQQIADDNGIITDNFDTLINNKKVESKQE